MGPEERQLKFWDLPSFTALNQIGESAKAYGNTWNVLVDSVGLTENILLYFRTKFRSLREKILLEELYHSNKSVITSLPQREGSL